MTLWLTNDLSPASSFSCRFIVDKLRAAECVYAEDEAQLLISSVPPAALEEAVEQRVSGTPLEYVLGWAHLLGHRIVLTVGVFISHRRSEFLAAQAMDLLAAGDMLLDLCCGSGALATAIAASFAADARLTICASDIDPVAVQCARTNLAPVGGLVVESDLYGGHEGPDQCHCGQRAVRAVRRDRPSSP